MHIYEFKNTDFLLCDKSAYYIVWVLPCHRGVESLFNFQSKSLCLFVFTAMIICIDTSSQGATDLQNILQASAKVGLAREKLAFFVVEAMSTLHTLPTTDGRPLNVADVIRDMNDTMTVFVLTVVPAATNLSYEQLNNLYKRRIANQLLLRNITVRITMQACNYVTKWGRGYFQV